MRGFAKIPFTCSYLPGSGNLNVKLGLYAGLVLIAADRGAAIQLWAAENAVRSVVAIGILISIAAALRYLASRTPAAQGYRIVFDDVPAAVVSPLSLNMSAAVKPGFQSKADELEEELQFHLRRSTDDRLAGGATPMEAQRGALRELGNITRIREEVREVWRSTSFDSMLEDLRMAARGLARSPAFSFTALILIGAGIGINGSVFSLFQAILHRPMSGVDAQHLVSLGVAIDGREDDPPPADSRDSCSALVRRAMRFAPGW